MRIALYAGLTGIVLTLTAVPACAAWHSYFNKALEFSFLAPGELKTEKGTYKGTLAGERNATVFSSTEDNIEYRVTVVDFGGRTSEETSLLDEAAAAYRAGKTVLSDESARVDSYYGRKMSADLPNNGGRSATAIYFKAGKLIQLEATVLPANGDYGTPDMGRFVESLAFLASRVDEGATELTLAE